MKHAKNLEALNKDLIRKGSLKCNLGMPLSRAKYIIEMYSDAGYIEESDYKFICKKAAIEYGGKLPKFLV